MALLKANTGIGITNPSSALHVIGDGLFVGIVSATTFYGNLGGGVQGSVPYQSAVNTTTFLSPGTSGQVLVTAGSGQNPFWASASSLAGSFTGITIKDEGSIVGSAASISSLNFVGANIVATASGAGATITLSNDAQYLTGTAPGSVISQSSGLTVTGNVSISGNISVGGTTAILNADTLQVKDKDIVLGITTNALNQDVSTDVTANHGGIAIASTEGSPLIDINGGVGTDSIPITYKQIMWLKSGSWTGLGTDAWLFNYGVGIGSTQFPNGTRLAVGSVKFTENDLVSVRNINASGIITATQFVGSFSGNVTTATYAASAGIATYATNAGIATYATRAGLATYAGIATNVIGGIASVTSLNVSGISTLGILTVGNVYSTGIITATQFVGSFSGNVTTATYAASAGIATYATNAGIATYATRAGLATYATSSGIATNVIGGIASVTSLNVSGISTLGILTVGNVYSTGIITATQFVGSFSGNVTSANYATSSGIATYATNAGIATNVIGGIASVTSLSVSGISTLGTVRISSGIVTATSGVVTYYGDGSNLTNINIGSISGAIGGITIRDEGTTVGTALSVSSLNFVGANIVATASGVGATITIADNLVGTALSISGISTFTNGPVLVGGGTSTGTASQLLQVTGGASFTGVGASVGIGTTNPTQSLHVQGNARITGGLYDSNNNVGTAGSVLSSTGSGLSWIAAASGGAISSISISTNTTNQSQYLTYVTGTGNTTGLGITTTGLVFNPSTGNLGIGITNPSSKLQVNGVLGISSTGDSQSGFSGGRTQFSSSGLGFVLNHNDNSPIIFQTQGVERFRWDHNAAALLIGTAISTGTASQPLQVTGGAYISGSVGIGTTNPISNLHINSTTARSIVFTGDSGASFLVMGNKDSGGTSGPNIIQSTNRNLLFGVGNSFTSSTGGTFTEYMRLDASGNLLVGSATSTGTASQALQVTGGAYVSGSVGIGTTNPTAKLNIGAGTSTAAGNAPLKIGAGTTITLLTTPEAGAVEYDGAVSYFTPDTTIGRGFIPATSTFRLTAAGGAITNTIANFFGTNSNIPLIANAFYEIDIYMLGLKGSSAGAVTWTLTNTAAPTSMFVDYEQSPLAGIAAPPGAVTALTTLNFRGSTTTTTAAYTFNTGSLAASVTHYFRFKLLLRNGTGTSLKIQLTAASGNAAVTPQAGSVWFARRLPDINTGTFAA